MLLLHCPSCGPRHETEFVCGGEAHVERPAPFGDVSAEQWATYLYFQDNARGALAERWCHRAGCGQWFNLVRDTVTHDVEVVYAMGEPRPRPA